MNHYARTCGTLGLTAFLLACSETLPPANHATEPSTLASPSASFRPPRCDDGRAWEEALRALPAAAIERIEPTYLRDTCAGTALVSGTKFSILPDVVPGSSWAALLECRTARVHLPAKAVTSSGGAPTWTPDGWVDVAIDREPKDLVLTVHADTAAKNILLFRRAAGLLAAERN